MPDSAQHVRFAFRQLRRSPGFTFTIVATLMLSVGANTAIFSLVNAVLLKSLPYPRPERMATIYGRVSGKGNSDDRTGIDGEKWETLRDGAPALISAVSGGTTGVGLQAGSRAAYVRDGRVSAHYFDVLGLQPLVGRNFSEDEDRPHSGKAAILSYRLWREMFGADPGVIGRAVLVRSEPYTVVGVLPQDAETPQDADLYTSLQASREGEGGGTNFDLIVRLREGATWQEADAQINRAWSNRIRRFETANPGSRLMYYSVPLQKARTQSLRPKLLLLMIAAGFVLLIACANLAGLTLVHMLRRSGEIATRLALGASAWQIQKQFWIENLLLALLAGVASLGVGWLGLRGLLLLLPEHFLPVASVQLDTRVMAYTFLVAVATSVLFGMMPAVAARRVDLRASLSGRGIARATSPRLRQSLVAAEVALTVLLLAGAGLLIRTLVHLETLPPGFEPRGLLVARASLDDTRFHDPAAFQKLLRESTEALRQIPGVQNAAVGLSLPFERPINDGVTISDGPHAGTQDGTDVIYVTPGYFDTVRMPLLAGRSIEDSDGATTQQVAVVNQSFARRFYGGESPVGHYVNQNTQIVGEVTDVFISSGLNPIAPLMTEPAMYIPATQMNAKALALIHIWKQPDWIVRSQGSVPGLAGQVQQAIASVDPNLPISGFYSMNDLLASTLADQRVQVALLGTMAGLALLLSTLGIFGLVANMVAHRTREIGIRMALGSSVTQAMMLIGRSGMGAALAGVLLGLGLSLAALRVMRSVLYGVGIYDVPTLTAVMFTVGIVALVASMIPTSRIASIDPAITLREE